MSYCTCLKCGRMVGGYQKYCSLCIKTCNLRQGDWRTFRLKTDWNDPGRDEEVRAEIEKDKL